MALARNEISDADWDFIHEDREQRYRGTVSNVAHETVSTAGHHRRLLVG